MSSRPNYERRSLIASKWASLVMAIAGVAAAWLSRSDALMLDGLFSGLGFLSAIFAIRISDSVDRAPDRRRPFGYAANQPVFIAFRSLVLMGMIGFAAFAAGKKMIAYFGGEEIEELVLGPILVYAVSMGLLGFGLAAYHRHNLKLDGTDSSMLRAEYVAAVMDGGVTVAAGGALLAAPLLTETFLGVLVPISDSIVVLALLAFLLPEPIRIMRRSLLEVLGEAPTDEELVKLRAFVERVFENESLDVLEVTMQRLGRQTTVVAYVKPTEPITGERVDDLRDLLTDACRSEYGQGFGEILIGARPAFQ